MFWFKRYSCALAACVLSASVFAAVKANPAGVVKQYCFECHDALTKKGGLNLEHLKVGEASDSWEKVIRKMSARQMPPIGKDRPTEAAYRETISALSAVQDSEAARHPNAGRTDTFRRLNRTEYQNAIRDLLALDIDAAALLPKDEAGHGFDNVTVADLSPTLLDRYLLAAQKIARLAVGSSATKVGGETFRVKPDVTQDEHVEGLPLGTRGGLLVSYNFPKDAEYEVVVRLTRDRNEEIEGLREAAQMEMILDRQPLQSFTITPPKDKNFETVDRHLKLRVPVKAGPHQLGVTFVQNSEPLQEIRRQPYLAHFNLHRHPRMGPAVYQVTINGPYEERGIGLTPSRKRIFTAWPKEAANEEKCAEKIISTLTRRAYRRPVVKEDLEKPMAFYREARANGSFEAGIEAALTAILVSPEFLFRVEKDPAKAAAHTAYKLTDIQLASRLSFFLWSSIPDDELIDLAAKGELSKPRVLDAQVHRMLADPRAASVVKNFASQWLYLRNLDSIVPEVRLFPDFDDNLRQAFRSETELFFQSVVSEDRSVLDLLKSDYTFLNERLAKHYGIPNVYGTRFRRVSLDPKSDRGGLLRQGSVLTVTSYATRTSPVIRGHWVLGNLLGTPPPPPPANVPTLKENTISESLPIRQRLGEHRANPNCASCHNLMDPVGFALENFDAVGRWRTTEIGLAVDAAGGFPDGSKFEGVDGLEKALLSRPDLFVGTLSEKLLTFALGRGIEPSDAPAIRKIVHDAEASNYRFSSVILGIVNSVPFKMRNSL